MNVIEQIPDILQAIDESGCEEFHLETPGLTLTVRKAGAEPSRTASPPLSPPAEPRAGGPTPVGAPATASRAPSPPPAAAEPETIPDGLVAVRAPMVGTFYRAPSPGAPPFVEVGGLVKATDTVCILEVMKLMNSIPAGMAGRVARICVENAVLVDHGRVLMLIEPA